MVAGACLVCQLSIRGQHLTTGQRFEQREGRARLRWFWIECPTCHGLVELGWAEQDDADTAYEIAGRDLDLEGQDP